ncbi:hypothetical protein HPB47_004543 [Ixodes persulcatus]|uniref:Uncharacterized protein n=1 Tax=Ixodes persulcatus TaxID=34615 RepID=A0AC60PFZ3_IXOPE|nr:hypothetical protein HPB47_004543 [Ixodes persulcatus]
MMLWQIIGNCIKFEPGILGEGFVLLKAKVSHLREEERKCVLMIDEMAIQDKFEYDTSTGCIRGWTTLTVPGVERWYKIIIGIDYGGASGLVLHWLRIFFGQTSWERVRSLTGLRKAASVIAQPRYDDSFETTLQARSRGVESVRYTPTS